MNEFENELIVKEEKYQKGFINYTNHPSRSWSENQIEAARKYGEIQDIPFPSVNANMDEKEVRKMAEEEVRKILGYNPGCVLCQGEFTLAYGVIKILREKKVKVVAACSERIAEEKNLSNGVLEKTSRFRFVRFREYQ